MTPKQITTELARDLGWPDAPIDRLSVDPTPTALATWMPIADMAAAAQGLVGLAAAAMHEARGGPAQDVAVDRWSASLSMTASAYLTVDGEKPVSWDPLTGYFRAADGWVYLHCQFPHLRDRLLEAFALPNDRDAVIAALAKLPAQQIEDRAAQAGGCAIMRQDRTTWDKHPQAAELKRRPVISLERVADLPTGPSNGTRAQAGRRRLLNAWTGRSPLEGVRVLDLSRVIAGPMMGRTLAEHGAEVLRIGASHLPVFEGLVINTGFGKRSAHVDLRTDAGRDTLASLIREADILIDGFRPGALAALGLGQKTLQDLNPNLIYLTLSAFGETGPWGGRRGFDTYVQCATGLSMDGPDGPTRLPCQPLDYLSGYLGGAAAMVALQRRIAEGGFWRIELALARTAIWLWEMTDRLPAEVDPPKATPSLGDAAPVMIEMASNFGHLRAMCPAVSLSDTPPEWRGPPVPLGSSDPVWTT